ncbi:MazG family protein [Curtobacterium sp. MCBD17_023]|uniref:MazG family protein n=1 Tax=Curtobacterium sp. MCBD17_023 TaxID=2175657 RepID=UPI000D94BCD4|nr:MazG family protein [Curtobacterium sp. MCBD17_023]PYY49617.1 nucleoside triphosphate pyrophosphohydrolase [Curtobacterium sp. MCBD17_023]
MTAVAELVAVVDRLLDPEHGCVWNREQTHATLARYAVEETYELVDAIDGGDDDELREELGDVLYQVVLHAGIAARQGRFDLDDVADSVREKMQRRHPHVFGDEEAHTVEDVIRVWRAAKAAEKSSRTSAYTGVPRAMPPLERAVKLLERLEERGDLHAAMASVTDGAVLEVVDPVPGARVAPGVAGVPAAADVPGAPVAPGAPGAPGVADAPGGADGAAASGAVGAADVVGAADPGDAAAGQQPGTRVDAAWGAGMLAEVAVAHEQGLDPIASLRAAVAMLEVAGRGLEQDDRGDDRYDHDEERASS